MGFALDTLVELQDQYSNVYPASPTGARGWVRARRELPMTDAEVYIEWDKGHWRYHGEKDGWTFEHHFRVVTDEAPEPESADLAGIIERAQDQVNNERCQDCGEIHDDDQTRFIDTLVSAHESLLESDGYFIIAVHPKREGSNVVYEPAIFSEALDPTTKGVVEAQILGAAVQLFQRHLNVSVRSLEGE